MFEGFERRTVDVGDGILVACVLGGEGPPVLLLHGFPQTHAMWARIAPHIVEAGYSVVCADLRGYGDSSKPRRLPDNSNYSFRAFAEDQLRLMRALGCEQTLLEKVGWRAGDVDLWEVNEAFAVVAMIAMREIGIPHDKINVHGGACALGHPIGASGARIMVTLLGALKQYGQKKGVASLCIGGGEATAIALEAA